MQQPMLSRLQRSLSGPTRSDPQSTVTAAPSPLTSSSSPRGGESARVRGDYSFEDGGHSSHQSTPRLVKRYLRHRRALSSLRHRLARCFLEVNPMRISSIDSIVEKMRHGQFNEVFLFSRLNVKYQEASSATLRQQLHAAICTREVMDWAAGFLNGHEKKLLLNNHMPGGSPLDPLRSGVLLCRICGLQPRILSAEAEASLSSSPPAANKGEATGKDEGDATADDDADTSVESFASGRSVFDARDNINRFIYFCNDALGWREQSGAHNNIFDVADLLDARNDELVVHRLLWVAMRMFAMGRSDVPPPPAAIQEFGSFFNVGAALRDAFPTPDPSVGIALVKSRLEGNVGVRTTLCYHHHHRFTVELAHPVECPNAVELPVCILQNCLVARYNGIWELLGRVVQHFVKLWDGVAWRFPFVDVERCIVTDIDHEIAASAPSSAIRPARSGVEEASRGLGVAATAPKSQPVANSNAVAAASPFASTGVALLPPAATTPRDAATEPLPSAMPHAHSDPHTSGICGHEGALRQSLPLDPPSQHASRRSSTHLGTLPLCAPSPTGAGGASNWSFSSAAAAAGPGSRSLSPMKLPGGGRGSSSALSSASRRAIVCGTPAPPVIDKTSEGDILSRQSTELAADTIVPAVINPSDAADGAAAAAAAGSSACGGTSSFTRREVAGVLCSDAVYQDVSLSEMATGTATATTNSIGEDDESPLQNQQTSFFLTASSSFLADLTSPAEMKDMFDIEFTRNTLAVESKRIVRIAPHSPGSFAGRGSYGSVFVGMDLSDGSSVAVKVIPLRFDADSAHHKARLEAAEREVALLSQFTHRNIVASLGATIINGQSLCIAMEYASGGTLLSMLSKFAPIPVDLAIKYIREIASGLQYLHERNFSHNDLKCENLLLRGDGSVAIADFGCSKSLADVTMGSKLLGTIRYLAPEIFDREEYSIKSDVWSFAACVVELCTGIPPWSEFNSMCNVQLIWQIGTTAGIPFTEEQLSLLDCRILQLVVRCFERDPDRRPTIQEAIMELDQHS